MTRANTDDKNGLQSGNRNHRCRTYGRVPPHCDRSDRGTILQALTAGHAKGHSRDEPYLPPSHSAIGRLETHSGALAIIIFAIDTFTRWIWIAVLYVIVVLMATNFLRRRASFLSLWPVRLDRVELHTAARLFGRKRFNRKNSLSLTAIGVTTILA